MLKMETKYKLHSKAQDNSWFHFRADLDSLCESFTVTYLSDGTCVLSGDYGTLTWKRKSFQQAREGINDFGFPAKDTCISYFAEKVCNFGIRQEIKGFNSELAWKELEEHFLDYCDYSEAQLIALKFKYKFDWGNEMTQEEFYNFLQRDLELDDIEDYGDEYNKAFRFRFELLQQISEIILEEVSK